MDVVEVLSNLHALRQLYELLHNIKGSSHLIHLNNVHQTLDVRAQELLKHLLDDATEKMFNTHSKIIEERSAVQVTPCSSQLGQSKTMPKLPSPLPSDSLNSCLTAVPSHDKDYESSKITSEKDERIPLMHQESKVSFSSDLTLYKKKKRCHACVTKEKKKQLSAKEATTSNKRGGVPGQNSQDQDQQHDSVSSTVSHVDDHPRGLQESNNDTKAIEDTIGHTLSSSVSLTTEAGKKEVGSKPVGEMKKLSDDGSDFVKVVTDAISQIESCILALQLSSVLAHSSVKDDVDEAVSKREMSQTHLGEPLLGGGTQFLTSEASQLSQKHGKSAEALSTGKISPLANNVKSFESLSRSASRSHNKTSSHHVNGLPIAPSHDEDAVQPVPHLKIPTTSIKTTRRGTSTSNLTMQSSQSMRSMASSIGNGVGKNLSQTRTRIKTGKRHDQIMMRSILLDDGKPSQRRATHQLAYVGRRKKTVRQQQVSEEDTISSSSQSSSWTSKQSRRSGSSGCSNESDESWNPRNDDFSGSESNSSESSIISSSDEDGRSRSTHYSLESLYSNTKHPDKSMGKFRKIKNRLGLIFHHHHHHHHHHHGNDHSTWKKVQNMFHHKNKHVTNNDRGNRGGKQSLAVKNTSNKNSKEGHFRAIVQGLMRHVKHSSKKKSKNGVERPPRHPHGIKKNNVVKKKLNWWHMYQRGGVKLLKKRKPIKVGYVNTNRPKLKMMR